MKKKVFYIMVVLLLLVVSGCGNEQTKDTPETDQAFTIIDAKAAKDLLDKENVVLVDVRTPEEFAEKHIPEAINLPNETIETEAASNLKDKDAKILVYCRTGVRAKAASEKLVKLGYQQVYDMGGIVDWPYDTTTGSK